LGAFFFLIIYVFCLKHSTRISKLRYIILSISAKFRSYNLEHFGSKPSIVNLNPDFKDLIEPFSLPYMLLLDDNLTFILASGIEFLGSVFNFS